MLVISTVGFLALWVLGYITSYVSGGFVHVLVAVAIVAVLLRFVLGRRARRAT